jgi:hypothetical protein
MAPTHDRGTLHPLPGELRHDKSGDVSGTNSRECVSVKARASVTPGLANEVDAVNQYAAVM